MTGRPKKHARREEGPAASWARPESPRIRWRHRAGAARHLALSSDAQVSPSGTPSGLGAEGGAGAVDGARADLVTVISAFAETALTRREQAEREAEQIRREADAYADAKRAEAERLLREARRQRSV